MARNQVLSNKRKEQNMREPVLLGGVHINKYLSRTSDLTHNSNIYISMNDI